MPNQPKQTEDSHKSKKNSALYTAQTRRTNALAKQEELKLKKIEGTLVDRVAVEKAQFQIYRRVRDALQNIPSRISGMLAAEKDQSKIFAMLTKEILQTLKSISLAPKKGRKA